MFPKDLYAKGLVANLCGLNMTFPSIGSCVWTVTLQLLELFRTVSTSRNYLPGGSGSLVAGGEVL